MKTPALRTVVVFWTGSKFKYLDEKGDDARKLEVSAGQQDDVDWISPSGDLAIEFKGDTPCDKRKGGGKLDKGDAGRNKPIEGKVRAGTGGPKPNGKSYAYSVKVTVNGSSYEEDPDMIVYE